MGSALLNDLPVAVRPALRRLGRRLAVGLFLDIWPGWAVASLLAGGLIVLVCRLFFASAAPILPWLWLAPLLTALPVLIVCYRRAYRPGEVVALADSLSGGEGLLLTLAETGDAVWTNSTALDAVSSLMVPRLRPWRRLATLPAAIAFLAVALLLPQRTPAQGNAALADDIAADLSATVVELKQQELITPDEEKQLEEEIERIRRGAEERVDASSWESADALREKVMAGLAGKQDAVTWAEQSLARYAAAAAGGSTDGSSAEAQSAELMKALEKLAASGMLAGAPADLQAALKSGKLPTDPKAIANLTASLSEYLARTGGRLGQLASLARESGRVDLSEFALGENGPDGDGEPGRGGINRGRADADLTWGKETLPFDRFKPAALPPGAPRNPDDWAPLAELPGAPLESVTLSARSAARQYAAAAGQAAWRRNLAPRHQSAVKKYFEK